MSTSKKHIKVGNLTLIRNVYKETRYSSKEQPDYTGKVTVEEENFNLAVWVNNDIYGVPIHMSGQVTVTKED